MILQKRLIYFALSIAATVAVILLFKPSGTGLVVEKTAFYMGTFVQIKASVKTLSERPNVLNAIDKAFQEIDRVERVFSVFRDDSEIHRINVLGPGETLELTDEMYGLIEKSIEYNKKTAGAFDVTVKPLVDIWKKAAFDKKLPAEAEIKAALSKTGTDYIVLDKAKKTISFAKAGMAIDTGGVAKGYAVDRAIKVLKANGIDNAIINSGGDMYCLGVKSKKEKWKIGIQHPRDRGTIAFEVRLKDMAVDTSGDYEKYFILNGKRYSHIIDPRTGYPIGDGVVSASVIAGDSTTSDILATSLCVLGEKGLGLISGLEGIDAIIIMKVKDGLKLRMTDGIEKRYDIKKRCHFIN